MIGFLQVYELHHLACLVKDMRRALSTRVIALTGEIVDEARRGAIEGVEVAREGKMLNVYVTDDEGERLCAISRNTETMHTYPGTPDAIIALCWRFYDTLERKIEGIREGR